jgi:hypothetical protein
MPRGITFGECLYLGGYLPASGPTTVRLRVDEQGVHVELLGDSWEPWLNLEWQSIRKIETVGVDQAQQRHSFVATALLGVAGLAVTRREFSAVVVVHTDVGELAFHVVGNTPAGVRAQLGPYMPEPPVAESDATELLIKLDALHEAGILTDEEFKAKKDEVLRRI